MNADGFIKEVLTSKACPDNFEEVYDKFKLYQNEALKTLQELHRVCEKNQIPYQLAFGSLLGVVRDGGQIPWDYDIDVMVPYSSKEDLINELKKDLDDNYYFYCPENNDGCRHVIMRLAPKGYRTEALHVDVFYYVGTPNDEGQRKQFVKEIERVSELHYLRLVKPIEESTGNIKTMLSICKDKIPALFVSVKKLRSKYNELCQSYPIPESDICVEADSFADWYEIPKEYLINTVLMETKIGTFRVSSNYKELLTIWYKDYMSMPPIEKRIEEVVRNTKRLVYFDKKRQN